MAVNVKSRYWRLAPLEAPGTDEATAALPMRPQPSLPNSTPVKHMLTGNESLEYLAWRFYGRSEAWWHVADANPLVFPLDYRPGISVALPQSSHIGRVLRTRKF